MVVKWLADNDASNFFSAWFYRSCKSPGDAKYMDWAYKAWEAYKEDPAKGRGMFLEKIAWVEHGHDEIYEYPDVETEYLVQLFSRIADRELAEGVLQVLDRRRHSPYDHLAVYELLGLAGKTCGKDAVEVIAKYVRMESDADGTLRCKAIDALGELGFPEATPHLVEKLGSTRINFRCTYEDDGSALHAAKAILNIGLGAIPYLEAAIAELEKSSPKNLVWDAPEFNKELHEKKIARAKDLLAELKLKEGQNARNEEAAKDRGEKLHILEQKYRHFLTKQPGRFIPQVVAQNKQGIGR